MPTFGDYETFGEPIATTVETGHVTTVWQARKPMAGDGRFYAIKCYEPRRRTVKEGQPGEELNEDRALNFLVGIKDLKKAQSGGGRCLAPVHAFGLAPEGAWYATDYCELKTLKEWIEKCVRVDDAALRHVVFSVVSGCLALKRSRELKYSHGNLKPSNVLLAGQRRLLRQMPLHLTDPHPAPLQLADLETDSRRTVGELLGKVVEVQDLRAIGELVFQLIEGRLTRATADGPGTVDWPVKPSLEWDKLGKRRDRWADLCNRLLDPGLSLEKESLEKLEAEFGPSLLEANLPRIRKIAVVLLLVVVAACCTQAVVARYLKGARYRQELAAARDALSKGDLDSAMVLARKALEIRPHDPLVEGLVTEVTDKRAEYDKTVAAARAALERREYTNVVAWAERALGIKAQDPVAMKLRDDAQVELTQASVALQRAQDYERAIKAAGVAYEQGNYTNALAEAVRALGIRPDDPGATRLRDDAQRQLTRVSLELERERDYQRATNAAGVAYLRGDYTNALAEAVQALGIRPDDPVATRLRDDAQRQLTRVSLEQQREQDYRRATNAAGLAYRQGDYTNALAEAVRALGIRPDDPVATTLRDEAQSELRRLGAALQQDDDYRRAIKAADVAYRRGDYTNALAEAARALGIRPNDPAANKLREEAQARLTEEGLARQQQQEYERATNAAGLAYGRGEYTNAVAAAERALGIRPNDAAAMKLRKEAQDKLTGQRLTEQQEQEYRRATNAALVAYRQGEYTNAVAAAERALGIRPNDAAAMKLRKEAQDKLTGQRLAEQQEQEYRRATNAALVASRQGDYTNAVAAAERALGIRPDDAAATKLRDDAQAKIPKPLLRPRQKDFLGIANLDFERFNSLGTNTHGAYVAVNELSWQQYTNLLGRLGKPAEQVREDLNLPASFQFAKAASFVAELDKNRSLTFTDLPKGHWRLPTPGDYLALAKEVEDVTVPVNWVLPNTSQTTELLKRLREQDGEYLASGSGKPPRPIGEGKARLHDLIGNVREWTVGGEPFGIGCSFVEGSTTSMKFNKPPLQGEPVGLRLICEEGP